MKNYLIFIELLFFYQILLGNNKSFFPLDTGNYWIYITNFSEDTIIIKDIGFVKIGNTNYHKLLSEQTGNTNYYCNNDEKIYMPDPKHDFKKLIIYDFGEVRKNSTLNINFKEAEKDTLSKGIVKVRMGQSRKVKYLGEEKKMGYNCKVFKVKEINILGSEKKEYFALGIGLIYREYLEGGNYYRLLECKIGENIIHTK